MLLVPAAHALQLLLLLMLLLLKLSSGQAARCRIVRRSCENITCLFMKVSGGKDQQVLQISDKSLDETEMFHNLHLIVLHAVLDSMEARKQILDRPALQRMRDEEIEKWRME